MTRPFRPTLVTLAVACTVAAGTAIAQLGPGASPDRRFTVLHVDIQDRDASDGNVGSERAPLRTVGEAAGRALANRRTGQATRVAIHPGVYREAVTLQGSGASRPEPAIVFEGTGPGEVVLSGSERWTGWTEDGGSGLYRHPMTVDPGLAPLPGGWDEVRDEIDPVLLRGEAVFVDGRLYRQVLSRPALEAEPGRFYVDDRASPSWLWLHLPHGVRPDVADIEVAVRPSVIDLNGVGQIELRHLTVRHAASQLQDPAVRIDRGSNLLIEDVRVEWNSWNGIGLFNVQDATLRRVTMNHNGAGGLNVFTATDLVLEDVDASYNNWRGAWAGFLGWATGQKLFHVHGARFLRYRAVGNQATGLWFDTDATDIVVDQAQIAENVTRGLYIEAIQGPLTIRNSAIRDNGETGIFATSAANVTLEGNIITGNHDHQIFLPWMADHHVVRAITDSRSGRSRDIRTEAWTLTGNTIGTRGDALLFSVGMWPQFLRTLRAGGNRWFRGGGPDGFGVYYTMHAPVGRLTLLEWQRLTRQELDSTFASTPPRGTFDE